ncbi:MAG TPA: hypothetical protein VHN36_15025, partial [Ilumatobacteraceae bacterium]|nr:hypothetical protein [Ilumatobacteraceae bacterium]
MSQFSADDIRRAALTPRWAALSQLGGIASDLHNYDKLLIREPRLLVPVDVQAMVVQVGVNDTEPMQRLPFRDGATDPPALDVNDAGTSRPAGVYVLWSTPGALGRGHFVDDPQAPGDATRRKLSLPPLPDRWLVLRLAVPSGARDPAVTGWVIEADAGTVTGLADWPGGKATSLESHLIPAAQLNVHSGGPSWTQAFDSALGRLSFYDDLADLAGVTVEGDALAYSVCGWWSVSASDPLDGVGTDVAYRQRLADLGWNDPDHPSPNTDQQAQADNRYKVATTFGLSAAQRYTQPLLVDAGKAANATAISGQVALIASPMRTAISGFLDEAVAAAILPPAPTRTTLLHGRIHGIPLAGKPVPDSRPSAASVRVVLGSSTPDVAATVSVAGTGMGSADQDARRAAERLLNAFASGDLMRIGSSDAWADIDEYEHAHAFIAQPGGTEGIDRFVDKPGPTADPGAGFRAGARSESAVAKSAVAPSETVVLWSAIERPNTMALIDESIIRTRRQFDGRLNTVPPPAPSVVREVARPAPRFHQPAAPVMGVAGGGRLLSAVEREEADGKLMCRLSDQPSRGHTGILASAELLTSLGSAAVPDEALDLAREALAEDPYLVSWRASRAKSNGIDGDLAFTRFRSEAALSHAYYAADNARMSLYVNTDVASASTRQKATEALARASMSEGVWAHPEGVTMWGQPWRPLFCDWEVTL